MTCRWLINPITNPVAVAQSKKSNKSIVASVAAHQLTVYSPSFRILKRPAATQREVHHNTVHHFRTIPGPPVTSQPWRLTLDPLAIAKAEFDAMICDVFGNPLLRERFYRSHS